jgi:hypothetical protein
MFTFSTSPPIDPRKTLMPPPQPGPHPLPRGGEQEQEQPAPTPAPSLLTHFAPASTAFFRFSLSFPRHHRDHPRDSRMLSDEQAGWAPLVLGPAAPVPCCLLLLLLLLLLSPLLLRPPCLVPLVPFSAAAAAARAYCASRRITHNRLLMRRAPILTSPSALSPRSCNKGSLETRLGCA